MEISKERAEAFLNLDKYDFCEEYDKLYGKARLLGCQDEKLNIHITDKSYLTIKEENPGEVFVSNRSFVGSIGESYSDCKFIIPEYINRCGLMLHGKHHSIRVNTEEYSRIYKEIRLGAMFEQYIGDTCIDFEFNGRIELNVDWTGIDKNMKLSFKGDKGTYSCVKLEHLSDRITSIKVDNAYVSFDTDIDSNYSQAILDKFKEFGITEVDRIRAVKTGISIDEIEGDIIWLSLVEGEIHFDTKNNEGKKRYYSITTPAVPKELINSDEFLSLVLSARKVEQEKWE